MSDLLINTIDHLRQDFEDLEYLREVKSGKEATVHLVKSQGELLALKVYKPHAVNSARGTYMHTGQLDGRVQRALKKRTERGKKMEKSLWTYTEYNNLNKLYESGASVPEVYGFTSAAILMQFIGDGINPAPRLSETSLTLAQAEHALDVVIENILIFYEAGVIHGDLSAYNILWFNEHPYIIDFPQALNIYHNRNAFPKLMKDLENTTRYFEAFPELKVHERIRDLRREIVEFQ